MILERALQELKSEENDKDILELLGIQFKDDYINQDYYIKGMNKLPVGDYFFSDLDGTFFRGVLQKEAFTMFVKFVKKQNFLKFDLERYYDFLKDLEHFDKLEKQAYNKEIEYFEYLNAGIYLLLKHRDLVKWEDYLNYIKQNLYLKEKVNPFRFSFAKIKEVLEGGGNFVFVSGGPNFIFDIYVELLKEYVAKNLGQCYANSIFGFGSYIDIDENTVTPLWGKNHKKNFINLLKKGGEVKRTIGGMGDTSSDFGISYTLSKGEDFYFVNPEQKVLNVFDDLKKEGINYHLLIERKDLIFEFDKDCIVSIK